MTDDTIVASMSPSGTGPLVVEDDEGKRQFRRKRRIDALTLRLWQLAVLGLLWGLWELAVKFEILDSVILKTPGAVLDYLKESWSSGELQRNTWATMSAVLLAFVLAAIIGVAGGVALGLMPRVDRVLSPFLDAINAMPRIALAPVFIVWLGIGMSAKVVLAVTIVVFIVLEGARAGVRSADTEILRLSAVLGINKRQLFVKVLLPVAVPSIFGGLRLGLIYSLLGVVGSEIIASQEGLGQLIAHYSGVFELQAVYGILLVLAAISAILNMLMAAVERWLLRWQAPVGNG